MNKKFLTIFAVMATGALAAFNLSLNNQGNQLSDISLSQTEAKAGWIEDVGNWWGRLDYNCISVTCRPLFLPGYSSNVAEYVGDGEGSVAHTWNCTGCGDYGWTVN
jgi:hypothetical protein